MLLRVAAWFWWWVAWACDRQGGYGYCVGFLVLDALACGRRDDLVRQRSEC
jgi:hypothetical protein